MRARGLFRIAGAVAVGVLLTASVQADQPNVRWGMSQAEVEAAVPGARPIRWGRTDNGAQARTQGRQRFGALELPARYSYDDRGLARVSFEAPLRQCRDLAAAIIAEHGEPLRFSDQVLVQIFIWHQPENDRRLRLMTSSAGFCDLVYEPLAEHLANDLASAPN
jgi:hypothetical protein